MKNYVSSMLAKLGLTSRTQAAISVKHPATDPSYQPGRAADDETAEPNLRTGRDPRAIRPAVASMARSREPDARIGRADMAAQ